MDSGNHTLELPTGHPSGLIFKIRFVEPYHAGLDRDGVTQLSEDEFEFEERRTRRHWELCGYTARFFYIEAANAILDVVTLEDADREDVAKMLAWGLADMWSQWLSMQPVGTLQ